MLLALAFLSGMAALVYEVLWMREFRLLFGATAPAAAAVLAAFFVGTASGSAWWGRQSRRYTAPLKVYAGVEAALAVFVIVSRLLYPLAEWGYAALASARFSQGNPVILAGTFILALVLLFPGTFCMGGAFPLLAEAFVRTPAQLGQRGAQLYAVHTAGGVVGSLLAGCLLPHGIGYTGAHVVGALLNGTVALTAWQCAAKSVMHPLPAHPAARPESPCAPPLPAETAHTSGLSRYGLYGVAALSGFVMLALEVLGTRMFEQILHNSVYTFSVVLSVFLAALAVGAALAGMFSRRRAAPASMLGVLLLLAGGTVGIIPTLFLRVSGGLRYLPAVGGWGGYFFDVFLRTLGVLGVPAVICGIIFPYLFRNSERLGLRPGLALGRFVAINTVGAASGAIVSTFLLLPALGLWMAIRALGLLYVAAAALLPGQTGFAGLTRRVAALGIGVVLLAVGLHTQKPEEILHTARGERVLEQWDGAHARVAVVAVGSNIAIRVNNVYTVGDLDGFIYERRQGELPMLLHPKARTVFLIGLGTGITAGGVLTFPLERMDIAELIPDVVTAARRYFADHAHGVFTSPRVRILPDDGRNVLLGARNTYDLIIADLFIPFHAGVSALYSREHYARAQRRLQPDGLFVQWLPAYQLGRDELFIIARTFLEVFPQVTLWRGNFLPHHTILALVGHSDREPFNPEAFLSRARQLPGSADRSDAALLAHLLRFYAGNLTPLRDALAQYPLNTENRPVIDYVAPISRCLEESYGGQMLTGLALMGIFDDLFLAFPPEKDPYLVRLTELQVAYVRAGLSFFKAAAYARAGQKAETRRHYQEFLARYPRGLAPEPEGVASGGTP